MVIKYNFKECLGDKSSAIVLNGKLMLFGYINCYPLPKNDYWQKVKKVFKNYKNGIINKKARRIFPFLVLSKEFNVNQLIKFPHPKKPYTYYLYNNRKQLVEIAFNISEVQTTIERNKSQITKVPYSVKYRFTSYYDESTDELTIYDPKSTNDLILDVNEYTKIFYNNFKDSLKDYRLEECNDYYIADFDLFKIGLLKSFYDNEITDSLINNLPEFSIEDPFKSLGIYFEEKM